MITIEVKIMRYMKEITAMVFALATLSMCVLGLPDLPNRQGLVDNNTWNSSATLGIANFSVGGGNYSNWNFTQNVRTDNWAILYGTAAMTWVFEDASQNNAYTFDSSATPSGYIFFANSTDVDWGTLTGTKAIAAHLTREDDRLGLSSARRDSVNKTFSTSSMTNDVDHPPVNYTGIAATGGIANGTSYALKTNDGSAADRWYTAQFQDGAGAKTYCAFVNQSNTAFNGDEADYQVMLPTPNGGTRDYFVYMALE